MENNNSYSNIRVKNLRKKVALLMCEYNEQILVQ